MRHLIAVLSACLVTVAAAAETRELTPQDMRQLATEAAASGRAALAVELTAALLQRDADDFDALLIRAQAARQLGEVRIANSSASRAWRVADRDDEKYAAALVKAQVLASSGRRTMSQLWLRRAVQVAPTEPQRAVAVRDFRYVRGRNPLQVQLSFSIAPNSNINNGSTQGSGTYELPFFGVIDAKLEGAALALSGVEAKSGIGLRYRLREGPGGSQTDLRLTASRRDYRFSEEAKSIAPDAEAKDFAFASTTLALEHRGSLSMPAWSYSVSGALGRSWYGSETYTQSADLAGRVTWVVKRASALSFHLGLRKQEALSLRTADSNGWRAGMSWQQPIGEAGHRLAVGVTANRSFSDYAALDWQGTEAWARLYLARPVLGTELELGLNLGQKQFDQGPVTGQDRLDRTIGAMIAVEPENYDFYGFKPRVTLSMRRTDSDFGQYDTDETGMTFGFRSAF